MQDLAFQHAGVKVMSFQHGIQQFLDDMDPTILSRGEDYYRSGLVESIDWDENHVTAEVSGSEETPFLVELDFSEDGEVEDQSCDCPYEWGPVCKHTAAVLLAIQAEPPDGPKKSANAPKIDIRSLLERAEKPQLAALILEHCREDLRFQSRVLIELEDSGEQELADQENEGEFYHLLNRLIDQQWENFQDTPGYGYGEQDKITRYVILCSAQGPEAARAYLEENLEADELRLILIREDIAKRDYAHAERLCRERLEKEQTERWYRPGRWQYLLYEIYRDGGQREEQICQACKLALLGDRDFYQTTKELLTEDGRWQEMYPGFLAKLKASRPAYEYMEILNLEREVPLLMEQVRLDPKSVFRYGDILAAQYQEEVYQLCTAAIREDSEQAGNRREYRALCGLIKLLAGFGGQAEAKAMIAELRQRYPRRPALLDELGRV